MAENRVICNCMDVDYLTIKEAIANGATTVEEIQEATGAGTACGGCIPDIEAILAEENN